jgi:hypothetical protein
MRTFQGSGVGRRPAAEVGGACASLHIAALRLIHSFFQRRHLLLCVPLRIVQRVGLSVGVGRRVLQLVRARHSVRWVSRDWPARLRSADSQRAVDGGRSTWPKCHRTAKRWVLEGRVGGRRPRRVH